MWAGDRKNGKFTLEVGIGEFSILLNLFSKFHKIVLV